MKRFILAGFFTALVLFPLFIYVYYQGAADGIAFYRRSHQFEMTLLSMYRDGLRDACKDPRICVK